jgi:hypothetical protein
MCVEPVHLAKMKKTDRDSGALYIIFSPNMASKNYRDSGGERAKHPS